jgi:hypothetical protein
VVARKFKDGPVRVLFVRVDEDFCGRFETRMAQELEQRPKLTRSDFVREVLERELGR